MNKKETMKRQRQRITTGDAILNRLYTATRDYIESRGGTCVVIGGVSILEEGLEFNYGVVVRATGKKPKFAQK